MKQKVSYSPKFNFHNQPAIIIVIDTDKTLVINDDTVVYTISKRQARRIDSHFCGMRECGCPKGEYCQLDPDGLYWGIPAENCNNY